jgi:hypothetical protein
MLDSVLDAISLTEAERTICVKRAFQQAPKKLVWLVGSAVSGLH